MWPDALDHQHLETLRTAPQQRDCNASASPLKSSSTRFSSLERYGRIARQHDSACRYQGQSVSFYLPVYFTFSFVWLSLPSLSLSVSLSLSLPLFFYLSYFLSFRMECEPGCCFEEWEHAEGLSLSLCPSVGLCVHVVVHGSGWLAVSVRVLVTL